MRSGGRQASKKLVALPIKNWFLPESREQVQTVTLQKKGGGFLSSILASPDIRCTARTQSAAEQGAIRKYIARHGNTTLAEDEDDARVIRRRERGKFISLDTFVRRHRRAS